MQQILNQKKILALLKNFYELVHVRVGLFDTEGKEVLAYPAKLMPYCHLIRQDEKGRMACIDNDKSAFQQAKNDGRFNIYICHAGLAEMIVPIRKQEMLIGYLMIGQFRLQRTKNEKTEAQTSMPAALAQAYHSLPLLTIPQVKAALQILQACASYVWMEEYIHIQEGALGLKIREYLMDHLEQEIQLNDLMAAFGIGKTKLCSMIRQEFNMPFSTLLRTLRMEAAKELLQSSHLSIAAIAQQVGIADYNYFSRIFRRTVGFSPSQYRAQYTNMKS